MYSRGLLVSCSDGRSALVHLLVSCVPVRSVARTARVHASVGIAMRFIHLIRFLESSLITIMVMGLMHTYPWPFWLKPIFSQPRR